MLTKTAQIGALIAGFVFSFCATAWCKQPQEQSADGRSGKQASQSKEGFRPVIEAPLPAGFPDPGPVGKVTIKQYPDYRMARTAMATSESSAFWSLFRHISENQISMTAPVEITYEGGDEFLARPATMAFLYQHPNQSAKPGADPVEIVDVPAMTAISLGLRGKLTPDRLQRARSQLEAWLRDHVQYEAAGPLRVMGYNSPFIAEKDRFHEIEIPVRSRQHRNGQ